MKQAERLELLAGDELLEHDQGRDGFELRDHVAGTLDGGEGEALSVIGHVASNLCPELVLEVPRAPRLPRHSQTHVYAKV